MGLDSVFVIAVLAVLFLGLLALIIGKSFVHRRDTLNAADTLWYVSLALVFCLGFSVFMLNRQLDRQREEMQEQIDDLSRKLQKYEEALP